MKKYSVFLCSFIFLWTSCGIDEDLNIDRKSPSTVPGSGLFTNGVRNFFDLMNSCSANENVFRLYAQYWAQTTYPDESQYNQVTRDISGFIWNTIYKDVLQDLKGAEEALVKEDADNLSNKLAVIEFMEVYAYSTLVDTFGNVPYSQALDPLNPSPEYDDAATIYKDLLIRLDAAIYAMSSGQGFDSDQDPIYGGDMILWKKAANSLKLRMAMRLADVDPALAEQKAVEASSGAIISNVENFGITYLAVAPNTNPLWVSLVQSGRNDFVGANTLIDLMNSLSDPRRDYFFEQVDGAYSGGIYGSANAASGFSALSEELKQPDLPGNIITAAEVHFLLAEAKARGFGVSGSEEEHYDAGITASILEWGGNALEVESYLSQPGVAYATAQGDWKQKIATQKWIAMFNNGFEGWTTWRLLDQPVLKAAEGMTLEDIPTRFIYPVSGATLNGVNYTQAGAVIGGDTKTTKLFWDKN